MKEKQYPPQEYLKECLDYDPDTGVFTWKRRPESHFIDSRAFKIWNTQNSGKTAGCIAKRPDGKRYILISVKGFRNLYAHRLAWLYINGEIPYDYEIDHINGDGTDNRYDNIRIVSRSENAKNLRKQDRNKTGVSGVHLYKSDGKFHPEIGVNGKSVKLGSFSNIDDAIKVRKDAEIKYGYHKNHGSERPL